MNTELIDTWINDLSAKLTPNGRAAVARALGIAQSRALADNEDEWHAALNRHHAIEARLEYAGDPEFMSLPRVCSLLGEWRGSVVRAVNRLGLVTLSSSTRGSYNIDTADIPRLKAHMLSHREEA